MALYKKHQVELLNHKIQGQGKPIIILHGLFGMLDNWQTVAKKLSEDFQVITVDLRNHGRSFHHDDVSYTAMAQDVLTLAQHLKLDTFSILGHSMGGKVAMQLALDEPKRVSHLIILDILPIAYERGHDHVLEALNKLPVGQLKSRGEAEEKLITLLDGDRGTALFLLKSLKRSKESGFEWRFNLSALTQDYDLIRQPMEGPVFEDHCLFIKGENSAYIQMDGWLESLELFPNAELSVISEAGHWVHADQPDLLVEKIIEFVA